MAEERVQALIDCGYLSLGDRLGSTPSTADSKRERTKRVSKKSEASLIASEKTVSDSEMVDVGDANMEGKVIENEKSNLDH